MRINEKGIIVWKIFDYFFTYLYVLNLIKIKSKCFRNHPK